MGKKPGRGLSGVWAGVFGEHAAALHPPPSHGGNRHPLRGQGLWGGAVFLELIVPKNIHQVGKKRIEGLVGRFERAPRTPPHPRENSDEERLRIQPPPPGHDAPTPKAGAGSEPLDERIPGADAEGGHSPHGHQWGGRWIFWGVQVPVHWVCNPPIYKQPLTISKSPVINNFLRFPAFEIWVVLMSWRGRRKRVGHPVLVGKPLGLGAGFPALSGFL